MGKIRAEYIWIDGTEPTPLLRSKTKVMDEGDTPPEWGFDGSSTNQATGVLPEPPAVAIWATAFPQ